MRVRMCTRMHRYQPGRHKGWQGCYSITLGGVDKISNLSATGSQETSVTRGNVYIRGMTKDLIWATLFGRLPGFGRKINNKQTKNSDEVTLGNVDPCRRQTGSKLWWHCTAGGCSRDRGIGVDDGLLCPWDRLPSHELTGFEAVCSARTSSW